MNIENRKVLVLGGYGLVGMAVCREMLEREPARLQIHSLRPEEAEEARRELAAEFPEAEITTSRATSSPRRRARSRLDEIDAQLGQLGKEDFASFLLYGCSPGSKPDVVIDCVNTSTGIAYRDIYHQASKRLRGAGGERRRRRPRGGGEPARSALRAPADPPRPGALPGDDGGRDPGLHQGRHHRHRRHGPQHPVHPLRGAAEPRAAVEERHGRRPVDAPVPHGAHAGRADHQGDQAGGGDRLEEDRPRPDPPPREGDPAGRRARRGRSARASPATTRTPPGSATSRSRRPTSTPARTASSAWRSSPR